MSNELFDKKIKERLESFSKPVSPQVWNKVSNQLAVPWYRDFGRRVMLPAYSIIATILLLLNFKEMFSYKEQIKLLHDKIATFNLEKIPNTKIETVFKHDTIYINKTVYVVKETVPSDRIQNEHFAKNIGETKLNQEKITEKNPIRITTKSDEKSALTNNNNKDSAIVAAIKKENSVVQPENEITPEPKKLLKDSVVSLPVVDATQKLDAREVPKKKFKLPKFDTRFGVSSGVGINGEVNLGPVFELFVADNLSFTTGLAFNKYPEIEYSSEKGFNQATGQNFINLYSTQIPPNYDALTEISINTSILELPINLNYYAKIKRNLDLKFMFGTHLDLKLYQNIKFETLRNGEDFYTQFNTQANQYSWHNMILGVGLQYRHRNLAFQISPTYIYNYKEVDYINSGGVFRVNGSVLINLKK